MKYKLYAIIMYGTDEEKLKLFKTRQNYLSYKLYVISGLLANILCCTQEKLEKFKENWIKLIIYV